MDVDDFEVIIDVLRGYRADEKRVRGGVGFGYFDARARAYCAQLHDNAHIISVEGEGSYAQQLQGQIKRYALEDSVSLHQAPYAKDDDGCWFRKDALRCILNNKRVDILIVDALPGPLCRRARQPAIPFFLPYLKQEGIVFLHDTCREDESAIADVWGRYFLTRREIDTPKGIALFVFQSRQMATLKMDHGQHA